MEHDEMARLARAAGLHRYLEQHPQQLLAALKSAQDLARRLPRDFEPAAEPAHALRLPARPEGRP